MGSVGRNENTQHEFDNAIYRAKRCGLNNGQMKILCGLDKWFKENSNGPSTLELAEISGVSYSMVYWTIPVLESLKYITVSRKRNGTRVPRSIRLWVNPDNVKTSY